MWSMLNKYLEPQEAMEQASAIKTGIWISDYREHVSWQNLIDALKIYIDNASRWGARECQSQWIGGAQLSLPAHVINEYCRPDRSFCPCPNFTKIEDDGSWRVRVINTSGRDRADFFSSSFYGGRLGAGYAVCRAGRTEANNDGHILVVEKGMSTVDYVEICKNDHYAMVQLFSIRQQQRNELLKSLANFYRPSMKS